MSVSERCVHYIDQYYQRRITLQELAEYVHLHPNYLCQLFREQTGKTVFEHINWVRVHDASKLLRSTQLPISQIAVQCGFQNTNYFSRIFKQFLGRSPSAYRKNNQASKELADQIQSTIAAHLQPQNDRTTKAATSGIYLLHHLQCPAVLVECGFLSNPEEAALLATEKYQSKLAFLLFVAIAETVGAQEK
jgi:AraC-like DNA-binding protein